MAYNPSKSPIWDVQFYGSGYNQTRIRTNGTEGQATYFADTKGFYQFLYKDGSLRRYTHGVTLRIARDIANAIPLGENSGDGHLKFQIKVQKVRGFDGRMAFAVYAADGAGGARLTGADYAHGKKVNKPGWIKPAIKKNQV